MCYAILQIEQNLEQRVCLKFCVANKISCAESLKMLQKVYGESVLSKIRAYEWYTAFKGGSEVVENFSRSGEPSTCSTDKNIYKVKGMVMENRHSSLREWDASRQGSFRRAEFSTKRAPQTDYPRHAWRSQFGPYVHETHHYGWRDVRLWVWHANQWTSFGMALQ